MNYSHIFARLFSFLLTVCFTVLFSISAHAEDDLAALLNVPDEFDVSVYATDELAHNIFCLTFDTQGRLLVSGPGYIRVLVDDDEDHQADRALEFANDTQGAQGLFADGKYLYCVSGLGLHRYLDADGDGVADGESQGILKINTGDEHDAHAIRRGPDGWWYLLVGNMAGVNARYATLPTSPFNEKNPPYAGALLRIHPQLRGAEIIASGFRNAYDFDFNSAGDIFVYDSDGERDITFPWYRPTRLYHITRGVEAGWKSKTWKEPSSYSTMPNEVASFGRGSPTGVVCYRHEAFPKKYHDSLFILDWTYGRIHSVKLDPTGSSYTSEPELFMSARGNFGFAPTDAEVGPDGALYVAIGGRGTRGTVFRIRSKEGTKAEDVIKAPQLGEPDEEEKLITCLNAFQPLLGWSRQQWKPIAFELGRQPFEEVSKNSSSKFTPQQQIRALEILKEVYDGAPGPLVKELNQHPESTVRARSIWALSENQNEQVNPVALFSDYLSDDDPHVVHQAILRLNLAALTSEQLAQLSLPMSHALGSGDRFVRRAAIELLQNHYAEIVPAIKKTAPQLSFQEKARVQLSLAEMRLVLSDEFDAESTQAGMQILKLNGLGEDSLSIKLDACRLIQLAWGDCGPADHHGALFDGYASQRELTPFEFELDVFRFELAEVYPTGEAELDHELLRLISMIRPANADLLKKIVAPLNDTSNPVDDIHRLVVASRIEVEWSVEVLEKISRALVMLEVKVRDERLPQDLNWNERIKELYGALVKRDPRLPISVVQVPEFGLPGHVVFMSEVPGDFLDQAVNSFVKHVREDDDYPWNNDVIFILGESTDPEIRGLIRQRFDEYSTRQAVIMLLSENPLPEETDLFIRGLEVSHLPTLGSAVQALRKLAQLTDPKQQIAIFQAARRLDQSEAEFILRDYLMELVRTSTNVNFGFIPGKEGYRPQPDVMAKWEEWFLSNYPEAAVVLMKSLGDEEALLMSRLESLDWSQGNAEQGKIFFEKRGCAQCHGGSSALGPDLAGVTGRFSRQDLFTATLYPDRDVSPRYQATNVITEDGLIFTGLVIYESIDGMILRDGLNRTHRIETENIDARTVSSKSLMPSGLLKNSTDSELVDLYTYLQSLQ
ncbi:hypothetical protein Pla110_32600 [Polystyrenella longa]|uniref:Cytochrome c domain-containing protein n=1 Tax=Polystyrenella longa TaxID=2528007 RepID=A0A518CQL4_9PLAN|nr:PVC-type heme-binding CxxCH protein [Polystyrenella longa]QDU81518.1 hypothetical protein Pla110_32600 [Polystyrenella longa]